MSLKINVMTKVFTKINLNEFKILGLGLIDLVTEIDGFKVYYYLHNDNCVAMYYPGKEFGTKCLDFKGDEIAYAEQDSNWPY